MRRLVVVGAGELGGAIAARWVARGGVAVGLTRTQARHPDLLAAGVLPSVEPPPDVIVDDDLVVLSVAGSAGQAEAAASLPRSRAARVVMVSTTGFFGDRTGPLGVDTPPGRSERAQAAARAEAAVRESAPDAIVVRLGGLYRQGRGPLPSLLRRGAPPPGPPDTTLALIHYDDAADAIVAALLHPDPDRVYLGVVPPLPSREAFYRLAAARHGLTAPRFAEPTGAPPRTYEVASFRRDLLPEPGHPDWRDATAG